MGPAPVIRAFLPNFDRAPPRRRCSVTPCASLVAGRHDGLELLAETGCARLPGCFEIYEKSDGGLAGLAKMRRSNSAFRHYRCGTQCAMAVGSWCIRSGLRARFGSMSAWLRLRSTQRAAGSK